MVRKKTTPNHADVLDAAKTGDLAFLEEADEDAQEADQIPGIPARSRPATQRDGAQPRAGRDRVEAWVDWIGKTTGRGYSAARAIPFWNERSRITCDRKASHLF